MPMAHERAGILAAIVRDRSRAIRGNHICIEIHHTFSGDACRLRAHAVRCMTRRAGESVLLNVPRMLGEAAVRENLAKVVALSA